MKPVDRRDHAIGFALCVAYVAILLYTAPDLGLSRDEGTYVNAARSYAGWLELLVHQPKAAFDPGNITRYWGYNHEHPPLWKTLFALSYLLDDKLGIFTRESLAFRFPGMLSAGLLLWLIYVFGVRIASRRVGAFAALAYALLPRPFYHSHLDAFDVPITLMITAVTYGYYRSLYARRWALALGLIYGLALASKHNSWLVPGVLAIHFAYLVLVGMRRRGFPSAGAIPYGLVAMLLLGPPIFFASWPWLWHDTTARLNEYVEFHLHHEYYNIAYFGVNYFWPPFPSSYPFVMTLFTVPVTTLVLALFGLFLAARDELACLRAALRREPYGEADDRSRVNVLLFGSLLTPIFVIALPSTPIFGGTKHWFTAYPFLALFAGFGFERALAAYRARVPEHLARLRSMLPSALTALLLAPALLETAHSHPFGLSHYGFAAGFVPGAADHGMNRQFWGFTTRSLVPFFERAMPHGGSVYVCDTTDTAFRMLTRDGFLPENIVPSFDIATADYALVHHELHFLDVDVQIWSSYGSVKPIYVLRYDGVPIISVYKNPHPRR